MLSLDLEAEFPILSQLDFFNHAAVAPLSRRAADALRAYALQSERHAGVDSAWSTRVREVKRAAARLIGAVGEHEIAFVANTSTGLGLVARGIDWRPGDQVVISDVEYPANRYPWEDLRRLGVELIEVKQRHDWRIAASDVEAAIGERTRLVSLSHVQYLSGYRMELRPIADAVHRVGGYLCVDAIQSLGAVALDVQGQGVDFLAADGHKWLLGPEGCGIFYVREKLLSSLHPAVVGWMSVVDARRYGEYRFELQSDARRFEPGSYNVPGILALGASLDLLIEIGVSSIEARIDVLTQRLCDGLAARGYVLRSPRGAGERSGIVSFDPPPHDVRATPAGREIVAALEQSGTVLALREGHLRASPHFYNREEQIDRLIERLP
jgi:selenocysteine lyase/cysteine desulfurase